MARQPAVDTPTASPSVRFALLALLPIIALAIYWEGQWTPRSGLLDLSPGESNTGAALFPESLVNFARKDPVRAYDRETLYEYINGHAEFFIGAGFQGLTVGEYGPGPSAVINLYDMGEPLHAFGVLVEEAGGGEAAELGAMGFVSDRGAAFMHGPYYAQISVFDTPALAVAQAFARELAVRAPGDGDAMTFDFPGFGAVLETRFIKEGYRGLEFVNRVVERDFETTEGGLQAFLIQAPAAEISAMRDQYLAFFQEDGIAFTERRTEGLVYIEVMDPYEGDWFFVPHQTRLLGVFHPPNPALLDAIQAWVALTP